MQNQMQFHGQQSHNNGNPALLNLLPNSGHQTDLNHLWTQLQELSQLLSINRESAAKLVQKADEAKVRATPEEGSTHLRDAQQESKDDVQSQNRILRKENATLLAENEDLSSLVNDYESVLEKVLEGLRIFIVRHEQSISTINIHQSYASQLAIERQVNADLRQEAAEFQARLAKLGAFLRMAHENESSLGPDVVIEELKAENMALRDALGVKLKEM
ncbi:hypothetical protein AOL_s00075g242 [Orbilia oligospora ATCC 24927]|uniref:Uncharacterized protein n=1 Tax=Arthrobotrys oligospora (strain ATCC 24927 / CBS 115.81 / DSM 1491) TaxID=756982 RepID=G1X8P3_ARTOA|nr:hypothetical protein AOL_s00075g242 [Orbilia oligospora ATCC 24927]EGX50513.1 hypothetical protein AOL_s00075g242 [Orbilia oligospora ATCC 24927]